MPEKECFNRCGKIYPKDSARWYEVMGVMSSNGDKIAGESVIPKWQVPIS
jgi:hypothetical protein